MIKFENLKQAVITAKKEEFEFEAVSCSKRHFPGVKGYSVRDFLDEYNKIMGLEGEYAYIWEALGNCYSLADLREDIRRNVPEYTAVLFDRAVAVIGVCNFDIASAYALIAKYIRRGGKVQSDIEEFGGGMLVDVATEKIDGVTIYKDYNFIENDPATEFKLRAGEELVRMTATSLMDLYRIEMS